MARILLTGFPTMGGSGLIATKLGLQLAQKGHDIHFLFYKEPFFLSSEHDHENVTFHRINLQNYALFRDIGAPYTIQAASSMIDIVQKEKIDIVHSHYTIPHSVVSYLAKQFTEVKTVVTAHGSDTHTLGSHPSFQPILKLALKNSSAITSVSSYLARETEMVLQLQHGSVHVVYNFVDTQMFSPTTEEKSLSIVQASNFRPIKQLPFMIDVFAKICDDFPEWTLKLIGSGPEYPVCLRKTRELGVRDRVEFLGVRKDVPSIFANSSILASTSKIESFGLTIAEGMSCGLPIWAPRVGGIPEICIDEENGYLYEPGNIDDAAEKLTLLMSDRKLREKLGAKGRQRILDKFSPQVIIREYEQIYEDVLSC